jgi:phage-related protein
MTETFAWDVTTDTGGGGEFVVASANFGDGYKQLAPLGINNDVQTWTVVFTGSRTEAQEVLDFIRAHAGAVPFYWTPPLSNEGAFVCTSYKPTQNGVRWRLSLQFQQTAIP